MRKRRVAPTLDQSLEERLADGARVVAFIPVDGYVEGHGWRVSLVIEGEAFHRPTGNWPYHGKRDEVMPWFWGDGLSYVEALKLCDEHNERRAGISRKDAALIIGRSMVAGAGQPKQQATRRATKPPKKNPQTVKRRIS